MTHKVLVYIEVRNGKLKSTGGECLAEARKMMGGSSENLHAVLLGEGCAAQKPTLTKASRLSKPSIIWLNSTNTPWWWAQLHPPAVTFFHALPSAIRLPC